MALIVVAVKLRKKKDANDMYLYLFCVERLIVVYCGIPITLSKALRKMGGGSASFCFLTFTLLLTKAKQKCAVDLCAKCQCTRVIVCEKMQQINT